MTEERGKLTEGYFRNVGGNLIPVPESELEAFKAEFVPSRVYTVTNGIAQASRPGEPEGE